MRRPPCRRSRVAATTGWCLTLIICLLSSAGLAEAPIRDQELFGSVYQQPLSRLSVFGGLGLGSVRGGGFDFTPSGRLALDLGALWDLGRPARLGVAFSHQRFEEKSLASGTEMVARWFKGVGIPA